MYLLSPRTWGWTFQMAADHDVPTLSPRTWGWTCANGPEGHSRDRYPHARGGGPRLTRLQEHVNKLSPRTWGWTEPGIQRSASICVIPTHVGVDLSIASPSNQGQRYPYARGGGPGNRDKPAPAYTLSPRTWGWTYNSLTANAIAEVIPTHVGVDLSSVIFCKGNPPLSPRTWGWT